MFNPTTLLQTHGFFLFFGLFYFIFRFFSFIWTNPQQSYCPPNLNLPQSYDPTNLNPPQSYNPTNLNPPQSYDPTNLNPP